MSCGAERVVEGTVACKAFTLLELLLVIALIGILAALLLPALAKGKSMARRMQCSSNLQHISRAVLMYADDHQGRLPGRSSSVPGISGWHTYKSLVKNYVGSGGQSNLQDRVFACPVDTFCYGTNEERILQGEHERPSSDYSSYAFNNANLINRRPGWTYPTELLGVGRDKDTAIPEPSKTVLVGETAAWPCYSWHQPQQPIGYNFRFNNARCVAGFVDGHVSYTRFYYDESRVKGPESWWYDPPAGYEYRWSAR